MPQLDGATYLSQVLWVSWSFATYYWRVRSLVLPTVNKRLKIRARKFARDKVANYVYPLVGWNLERDTQVWFAQASRARLPSATSNHEGREEELSAGRAQVSDYVGSRERAQVSTAVQYGNVNASLASDELVSSVGTSVQALSTGLPAEVYADFEGDYSDEESYTR